MKKQCIYLLSILLVGLFTGPLTAQTLNNNVNGLIQDNLTRQIVRQQLTNPVDKLRVSPRSPDLPLPAARDEKHLKIIKALHEEMNDRNHLEIIDWEDFLLRNKQLGDQLQQEYNNLQLFWSSVSADKLAKLRHWFSTRRMNYAQEIKDSKYVYVGDASSHDQHQIVQEVQTLLADVRAANPHARILLALEFVYSTSPFTEAPIQFASNPFNPSLYSFKAYAPLLHTAHTLQMDVLGLDDSEVFKNVGEEDDLIGIKIGNSAVLFSLKDPQIKKIAKSLYPKNTSKKGMASAIHQFIDASSWGVQQRNNQWARYIKAVSPFYDIIIVYAGSGHLEGSCTLLMLPDLLGQGYTYFAFYSEEQLPQEDSLYYEERTQLVCDEAGNCRYEIDDQMQQQLKDASEQSYKPLLAWDHRSILYSKSSSQDDKTFETMLTAQELNALKQFEQQYPVSTRPNYRYSEFEIFLPAVK